MRINTHKERGPGIFGVSSWVQKILITRTGFEIKMEAI